MSDIQSYAERLRRTAYFNFLLITVTLGPLLFGYHLVRPSSTYTLADLHTDHY